MGFENRYSFSDRLLHQIAFRTPQIQVILSDIEDSLFGKGCSQIDVSDPVFICSIPRAGTTLLLELLVQQGEFVSHSYRDMPFVLTPLIWDRLSSVFRKSDSLRERAHGDGVKINVDSPEAFEEIIWKAFWSSKYRANCIDLWGDDINEEFEEFFRNHLRKIVALRGKGEARKLRYISKNNLNIARISYLGKLFPGAKIIIPFRDPVRHVESLLKQHLNFLSIHRTDKFARDYMQAIGHFDFGDNLRPVDFDGWCSSGRMPPNDSMEYWLLYWIKAYGSLWRCVGDQVVFFDYEAFCENPESGLSALSECLGVKNRDGLLALKGRVKTQARRSVDMKDMSEGYVEDAYRLLGKLKGGSIC